MDETARNAERTGCVESVLALEADELSAVVCALQTHRLRTGAGSTSHQVVVVALIAHTGTVGQSQVGDHLAVVASESIHAAVGAEAEGGGAGLAAGAVGVEPPGALRALEVVGKRGVGLVGADQALRIHAGAGLALRTRGDCVEARIALAGPINLYIIVISLNLTKLTLSQVVPLLSRVPLASSVSLLVTWVGMILSEQE